MTNHLVLTTTHKPRPHIVGLGGTLRGHSTSLRATEIALEAAEAAGATTQLLPLRELDLPIFEPGIAYEDLPNGARRMIEVAARADGMIWSTAAYHGTLAGITKNALDYFEFLHEHREGYLDGKAIGLIATAGGTIAAINSINAMVYSVHSLRGTVVSLQVPIAGAGRIFKNGELTDTNVHKRLTMMGEQVVDLSARLRTDIDAPLALAM